MKKLTKVSITRGENKKIRVEFTIDDEVVTYHGHIGNGDTIDIDFASGGGDYRVSEEALKKAMI